MTSWKLFNIPSVYSLRVGKEVVFFRYIGQGYRPIVLKNTGIPKKDQPLPKSRFWASYKKWLNVYRTLKAPRLDIPKPSRKRRPEPRLSREKLDSLLGYRL